LTDYRKSLALYLVVSSPNL